jgi:hypothetical protein
MPVFLREILCLDIGDYVPPEKHQGSLVRVKRFIVLFVYDEYANGKVIEKSSHGRQCGLGRRVNLFIY